MLLFAILIILVSADLGVESSLRDDFDCAARKLMIEFAAERNPSLNAVKLQQIADALNGNCFLDYIDHFKY